MTTIIERNQETVVFRLQNQKEIRVVLNLDDDCLEVYATGKKHGNVTITPKSGNSIHIRTTGLGVMTAVCKSCGDPIHQAAGRWVHTLSSPRHPAVPKGGGK